MSLASHSEGLFLTCTTVLWAWRRRLCIMRPAGHGQEEEESVGQQTSSFHSHVSGHIWFPCQPDCKGGRVRPWCLSGHPHWDITIETSKGRRWPSSKATHTEGQTPRSLFVISHCIWTSPNGPNHILALASWLLQCAEKAKPYLAASAEGWRLHRKELFPATPALQADSPTAAPQGSPVPHSDLFCLWGMGGSPGYGFAHSSA